MHRSTTPGMKHIEQTTHTLVHKNFVSSTFFEIYKALHSIGLFLLLKTNQYAIIGTAFSIIYLTISLIGSDGGYTVIPHIESICRGKSARRNIILYVLFPQIILLSIGSTFTWMFYAKAMPITNPQTTLLVCVIVLTEGLRATFRVILHTITPQHSISKTEAYITLFYLSTLWAGYFLGYLSLTLETILSLHLIASLITLGYFTAITHKHCIATQSAATPAKPNFTKLVKTRSMLALLHLPQTISSGNFLTPFFAATSGLHTASLIKIASELSQACKAIIKTSFGLTSNALLTKYTAKRKETFHLIWRKLANVITAMAITTSLILPQILFVHGPLILFLIAIFAIISFLDYSLMMYEQFFLVTNRLGVITITRIAEMAACLCTIALCAQTPMKAIVILASIRCIVMIISMHYAHKTEHIHPFTKISKAALYWGGGCGIALNIILNLARAWR